LLQKLVYSTGEDAEPVKLDWNPNLSFSVPLEIRDVSTNPKKAEESRIRAKLGVRERNQAFNLRHQARRSPRPRLIFPAAFF